MEKELKIKLDEHIYNVLKNNFVIDKEIFQTNIFLDSVSGIFNRNGSACRIRNENNKKFYFTLKKRKSLRNGYFQAEEFELDLTFAEYQKIIQSQKDIITIVLQKLIQNYPNIPDEISNFLENLICSSDEFFKIGEFSNQRLVFSLQEFICELDKTTFFNTHINYELEIETEENKIKNLYKVLQNHNIPLVFMDSTKFQRFLEYRKMLNN